jgi:glycosyltransferase involved in cell wall biosynthesis
MASYVALQAVPAMFEARRFRPDVVHAHFAVPSGPVAWLASRFSGAPLVVTAHLGDVPGGVPEQTDALFRLVKPFTVPIWRGAAATTAVASHVAMLAEASYGVRPRVIVNGIAMTGAATPTPRTAGLRMIWCGRIQLQKNLSWGIDALAGLKDRDWTLDIIGDGPLRADALARSERHGLQHHVVFHSWMETPQVQAAMSNADVLFLPSLTEGLSLVTVEALRAGLAFVASRIPGVTDVVEHGRNGLLFDPADATALTCAVARMIDEPELVRQMQAESLARRPAFDEEAMINSYEDVLASAARMKR